jgi:6-phosphofructokinase
LELKESADLIPSLICWVLSIMQDHFKKKTNFPITLKYIDPTYMIRAVRSNASDNVYCTLLAHSALHGAMAGYTGYTVAPVNGRHAYIPFYVSPENCLSTLRSAEVLSLNLMLIV